MSSHTASPACWSSPNQPYFISKNSSVAPSTTSYSPPATNELPFPNLISSPPVLVFYAGFLTQRNVKSPRYPTEKRCIDTPIGHHGPFATFSPDSECVCMPSYQYLSHHWPSRCQRCRSRKVKCSGVQPCDHCRRRGQNCVFDEDRKIVVSEGCVFPGGFFRIICYWLVAGCLCRWSGNLKNVRAVILHLIAIKGLGYWIV